MRDNTGAPLNSVFAKYSAFNPCALFAAEVHNSAEGTAFTTSPISEVPCTYLIFAAGNLFFNPARIVTGCDGVPL